MNEELLKQIMRRIWRDSEDVRGEDMIEVYAVERIIRKVFAEWNMRINKC